MSDSTAAAVTKTPKTPAEKKEARGNLLTLLLIVLVGVGILYFGWNLGIGVLAFILWIGAKFTGSV
jgi:hypothetical protein